MKYNYGELEADWLTGKYKSLTEFSKVKNIPYATLFNHHKRWKIKRNKINEKVIEKASNLLAKMTIRHCELGQKVADIGIRALERADKAKSLDASNAIQAVRTGTQIEREVLMPKDGVEDKGVTIVFQALADGTLKRPIITLDPVKEPIIDGQIAEQIQIARPKDNLDA